MKYEIYGKVFSLGAGTDVHEAKNKDDNARMLALRLSSKNNDASAFTVAERFVESLRNERGLLPFVEMYTAPEHDNACFAIYEWKDALTPLAEIERTNRGLWIMRATVRILEELDRRRLSGQFVGEQAIFVDEKNYSVCLAFIGLTDALQECNAGPWERGTSLDYRDDIYHLGKCFKEEIEKAELDILFACLSADKDNRPNYRELLRKMNSFSIFHPYYKHEVFVMSKIPTAHELVTHLNTTDCYVSPWEEHEHKNKNQRQCRFQTNQFSGRFVNSKDSSHFFVPNYRRQNGEPQGEILRARFLFTEEHPEDNQGYHHLTSINETKSTVINNWRIVPKSEMEFIKEAAFNARYCHVRDITTEKSFPKLAFLLSPGYETNWQDVQKLKEREKQMEAMHITVQQTKRDKLEVGMLDDITPERLSIEVSIDRHVLPELTAPGDVFIGEASEIPFHYESFWRQGSSLFFASAKDNEENLFTELEQLAKSNSAVISQRSAVPFGTLQDAVLLSEIITRDARAKFTEIPKSGLLKEDIEQEITPFKRQIDAVNMFARNDFVEPDLCGILATPKEYRPNFVNGAQLSFFEDKLDESQRWAVKSALLQQPLFLIQGPPGTGKTTVIVEIIRQKLAADPRARILVCSQTNLAVDNVLERLPGKRDSIRKVRLASNLSERKITNKVRPLLADKKIDLWVKDTINRSKHPLKVAVKANFNQENAIRKVINKWQAFLRDPKNETCQMRGNVEGGWLSLETAYLKSMNVLGATCVHIAASRYRDLFGETFDCLIIDEASKATPAETLIPISRAKHVVLIGDHKQLPPFVTKERKVRDKVNKKMYERFEDEEIEDLSKKFGKSLFETLISHENLEYCQVMLNTQRRMPKQIGALISKHFYDGNLQTPDDDEYDQGKHLGLPFKNDAHLVFIDTSKRNQPHDNGKSAQRQNECNAEVIVKTLHCLDKNLQPTGEKEVVIIAGYKAQVELLRKCVNRERFAHLQTDVETVDGFQGRENAVIIYDTVRSSDSRDTIGFLDEPRRLNVALSRAQKLLIIVGNAEYLVNRARPTLKLNPDQNAERPILGEITREIQEQNGVFQSLEDALE